MDEDQDDNYYAGDNEGIDDFPDDEGGSNLVMGFREGIERQRTGAQFMGTQIEGEGVLARAQQRMQRRQEGNQVEQQLLIYFGQLGEHYKGFSVDDEVVVLDKFRGLKHYLYKNPYVFLLSYIATYESRGKELTKRALKLALELAVKTNQLYVKDTDIVRYWRLINRA